MSDREKKLVLLFGLAAFLLLNAFGVSWFSKYKEKLDVDLKAAEGDVQTADAFSRKYDTVIEEMEWLGKHTPKERAGQLVSTELEQFASNQATTHQLEVKRRAILTNDETGKHFHRAKVEFNVTGNENSLYRWLGRLQTPDQFRAVTFLRLSPDAKDDTLIDCTAIVEQWYVPASGDGGDPAVDAPAPAPVQNPAPTPAPAPVPNPAPGANPGTTTDTPAPEKP